MSQMAVASGGNETGFDLRYIMKVEPSINTFFKNTRFFTVVHRHQVTEFNTAKIRIITYVNLSKSLK